MNHFIAHSRLAPIQIAFWGNPITSASRAMDYFVSADVLEHPFRTRMDVMDEPYSEQVALLEGIKYASCHLGIQYVYMPIHKSLCACAYYIITS